MTYTMAMPVEDLADTFLQLLDQDRLIGPPAPCRALPRPTRGTRLCLVALAAVLSILLLTVIFGNTQNTPQSIWEALWLLMASVALTTVVVMFWATIGSWVKSKIVSEFRRELRVRRQSGVTIPLSVALYTERHEKVPPMRLLGRGTAQLVSGSAPKTWGLRAALPDR